MGAKAATQKTMKGAQIVVQCLEQQNVDVIFAYPGGASMELHQALCDSPVRVILPRHEQGGAFAAAGYARATGKTGVCMATSGPGATNLVTGITDAYMDSVPMVAVTGQVPHTFIGKNAFQETDIIGITRPVCKHSFLVLDVNDICEVFAEAFYLANSGRPGPVVVDLPKDVQQALCVPDFQDRGRLPGYEPEPAIKGRDIERIREAIEASERPCIYAGGGIIAADAHRELRKFVEEFNIPVVTTLMGVGAFPDAHPLSLHWLGMHGSYYGNYAANECDLLIGLGVRFDDRVTGKVDTFARKATIIHVDIDPSEINKNVRSDIGVIGDVKVVLRKLLAKPIRKKCEAWHTQVQEWKRAFPFKYQKSERLQPQYVVEALSRHTDGKAIVVTGVGQHQMWAAQYYQFERPRQLLTSGGLGAMGFGLPSAIGAKVACPDTTVINIDGDGSFQMNIQELGTVHAEDIGVKSIILNNQHLGMVAQWEDRFYDRRRGNTELRSIRSDRPYPDFVQIAKGYLVPGRHVWKCEELDDASREMLEVE
ncbi:MAG: biosynthetic-type acetolactate synthase large subunit, partial [Candidatus Pacebacteria bacterium]|nr:biosynthetic-type acetolactate synthase large subunit [Candidatus Paceibacterota bacterium]